MPRKERLKPNVLETKIEFCAGERVNLIRILCINEAINGKLQNIPIDLCFYVKWKRCVYKAVIYTHAHGKNQKRKKLTESETLVMYT